MEEFLKAIFYKTEHDIEIRILPPFKGNQLLTKNIAEIKRFIKPYIKTHNIHFGAYTRQGGYKKENIREATCLYADLDFKLYSNNNKNGESKANEILNSFKHKPSIIVHTGNGYHVYWLLKSPIKADTYIETYLRGIANTLNADKKFAEIARIPRLPETFNLKDPSNPKPVYIVEMHNDLRYELSDFEEFKEKQIIQTDNTYYENRYSIEDITSKCEFIKYCYEHSESLPEPLWYSMISNLARLNPNGIELCHKLSEKHPKYSANETDKKILHALKSSGPHTCDYIKADMQLFLKHDCGKNCNVKSPISIINQFLINDNDDLYKWIPNVGLQRLKITKNGEEYSTISNFRGVITKEVIMDDGKERKTVLHLYLEAFKNGKLFKEVLELPSKEFAGMKWPEAKFPSILMITPTGSTIRDQVKHSIQYLSNNVTKEVVYIHTGWAKEKDNWFYITGDGAIGANNIKVNLKQYASDAYSIPITYDKDKEINAIKTSFAITKLGKEDIVIPLWIYTYLSTLTTVLTPMPNFILYLYGKTGSFKTTLAQLALSHFGNYSDFSDGKGSCSFEDTINAIEKRGFHLKDSLMLLDDYCPTTNKLQSDNMKRTLHRIIRNYSNRTARKRLNPDATEKGSYEPRGLIIVTGEDSADVESSVARLLELDIKQGDINTDILSEIQANAELLPIAMSSFIQWCIPRLDKAKEEIYKKFIEIRNALYKENTIDIHKRHIEQATFMILMSIILTNFLKEKNILDDNECKNFIDKVKNIFTKRKEKDLESLKELSEIEQFFDVVETLILQEKIYLFNKITGQCTANYVDKGDVKDIIYLNDNDMLKADPRLKGEFCGWWDDDYYYFIPKAIITAVYDYYRKIGTQFPVSQRTLKKRLKDSGFLITQDESKEQHLSVLERIGGKIVRVLKIKRIEKTENIELP